MKLYLLKLTMIWALWSSISVLVKLGYRTFRGLLFWKNAKVRDLFDSMYKGYPVGYLLFWQNVLAESTRTIGSEIKQKPPRLVIVDGQQRLTSLYAVIKNTPVLRENFESERIQIAFNPLEERFEVADAYCPTFFYCNIPRRTQPLQIVVHYLK